ncbi:MAG: glutathione transferase GstA [Sneathiella sp.]
MKLFYAPYACSLASHITCLEAEIPVSMHRVDIRAKTIGDDGDFFNVNSKGQVPALEFEDGSTLTEGAAVLQYLADLRPDSGLAPKAGSMARYRLMEWLNFISTELHKRIFYAIFDPNSDDAAKERAREAAHKKLEWLDNHIPSSGYLLGDTFSVADAYLYWWLFLAPRAGLEFDDLKIVQDYINRCEQRPAIKAALAMETEASQAA